jgi:hypothetical protein
MSSSEPLHNSDIINRLKGCYNLLQESRLVKFNETDEDAILHFCAICNDALPKDPAEQRCKNMLREIYHTDKTSCMKLLDKVPHYILITEAREIVNHFGIQHLVYISWTDNQYHIEINTKQKTRSHPKSRRLEKKSRRSAPENVAPETENIREDYKKLREDLANTYTIIKQFVTESQSKELQNTPKASPRVIEINEDT